MSKNGKKHLALLLCLVLCLSLFPTTAFANDEEVVSEEITDWDGDEVPTDEPGQEEAETAEPVNIRFLMSPENALLSVYTLDDYGYRQEFYPDEDGSIWLHPGEYHYDAEAEGYEALKEALLTVEEGTESLEIKVELSVIPMTWQEGEQEDEDVIIEEATNENMESPDVIADEETEFLTQASSTSESDYLKKVTTVNANMRCKVLVSSVKMYSLPVMPSDNSASTVLKTISKDARVQVTLLVQNTYEDKSGHTYWFKVSYSGTSGYIPRFNNPKDSSTLTAQSSLLEDCTVYTCYATIKATKATNMWSLPISSGNDSASTKGASVASGQTYTATALYKNPSNGYWYKVGDGKYISSGDSTATLKYDTKSDGLTVSITNYPKGTMHVGDALTLKGTVKTTHLPMKRVGCFVYATSTSSEAETYGWATCGKKSFSIQGTDADNKCKIGSLKAGSHVFMVKIEQENHYAENGKLITADVKKVVVFQQDFKEGYKITYNANGGTTSTVPADQWKYDKALTLQSSYPSRSKGTQTIAVTFNANGGSCATESLNAQQTTSYSFSSWNTKANGSGTNYNPGGSYSASSDATLYAQWTSNTSTASVTLPYADRSGYEFLGWSTSSSATTASYTGGSQYTPTGAVTLYAVWKANPTPVETYTVSYDPNGGTGAPGSQTKTKGQTLTLSGTRPTRADKKESGYTVTLNANGGSVSSSSVTAERTTSYTFTNWNTQANGSGTAYNAGGSYTADANATLYAQWSSQTNTSSVTLPTPTRSGYSFEGWGTSASASSGVKGSYTPNGNVTLYATWKSVPAGLYMVSYDPNGGTGAPGSQTKTKGQTLTLSGTRPTRADKKESGYTVTLNANGGSVSSSSVTAERTTSYTFTNWNTQANGSGTAYNAGGSYTADANATLYAQWSSQTNTSSVTLPTPTRSGYSFEGWGTSASASSGVKGSYTPNGNVTLYAVWSQSAADPVKEFVRRGYQLMLDRDADESGLNFYTNLLKSGQLSGAQMISNFMNSPEFTGKNYSSEQAVRIVYQTMLNREPDAGGLAYHSANLEQGLSYNSLINNFSGSPEFIGICEKYGITAGSVSPEWRDQNLSVTAFVRRNYKLTLEREGAGSELNFYCELLLKKIYTPQQVANSFVFSPECIERDLGNRAFITMLYHLYMDRNPDESGMSYYLKALNSGTSREAVEAGFGNSPEFGRIVASYGL